jgi:hypothetical protein
MKVLLIALLPTLLLLAGADESAELLVNKALSALQAGSLVEAEIAAEKAAARGGPRFFALRDFLLGNAAFARCLKTEAKAGMPEAEPFLFDLAIRQAEQARDFWQQALLDRPDWEAARRNVERALLKLNELKMNKRAREKENIQKKDRPEPEPQVPPPDLLNRGEEIEKDAEAEPQLRELPAALVNSLFDKLKEKEREKIDLRKAQQRVSRAEVEKDW